jgi:OFA family oxalate/formate antiporter-like MFS transporter
MAEQDNLSRWKVVVGALIVQICLGVIYSYSMFNASLYEQFHWSPNQIGWPFSLGLAFFAGAMIFAGRVQDKVGPRPLAILGSILLGIGYILASLTPRVGSPLFYFYLTYGVIGGIGIGVAYVCPIAAAVKWYPDKRGLITGLSVAGFGGGAFMWGKIGPSIIGDVIKGSGDPGNWTQAIFIIGLICGIAGVLGSLLLKNPPPGFKPAGWVPPSAKTKGAPTTEEFTWQEMVRTPQFWMLWLMFTFGALAGLMTISIAKPISKASILNVVQANADSIAAWAFASYAIFNALGRILWGRISDAISRKGAMFIMFLTQGIFLFILIAATSSGGAGGAWFLVIMVALIYFNFGGNFSLFPSATADFWGTKNLGVNYGLVFSAYGIGGILGPQIAGYVKSHSLTGNYTTAYLIAGVLCLIAAVFSLLTRAPHHQE